MAKKNAAAETIKKGSGKQFKKKDEKKGSAGKVIGIIAAILAVVLIAGVLVLNWATKKAPEWTVAAESENFSVSGAGMTYYFNNTYQNYVQTYQQQGITLDQFGLDTNKSLSEQEYLSGGQTWYDFILEQSKTGVRRVLVLNEAAKADKDFDMKDDIAAEVDENIASMKSAAEYYNVSFAYYLKAMFGEGVTEDVIRDCLTLSETASHYEQYINTNYKDTVDDAALAKYFEDNKNDLLKVDYLSYTFTITKAEVASDADEETKAAAEAKDKEAYEANIKLAETLAAAKTEDEFKASVEDYLRTVKYADAEKAKLEESVKTDLDKLMTEGKTYSDNDLGKWLFADERAALETYTDKSDSAKTVTVYMILAHDNDVDAACKYRDTYKLRDVYLIQADDKAQADQILATYEDNATKETMESLVSEEQYNGGHTEYFDKTSSVSEINDWVYDSARKAGDCEIISVETTSTKEGSETKTTTYYVVYYAGETQAKWQYTATNTMASKYVTEQYEGFEGMYKVSYHSKGMGMVKELNKASSK